MHTLTDFLPICAPYTLRLKYTKNYMVSGQIGVGAPSLRGVKSLEVLGTHIFPRDASIQTKISSDRACNFSTTNFVPFRLGIKISVSNKSWGAWKRIWSLLSSKISWWRIWTHPKSSTRRSKISTLSIVYQQLAGMNFPEMSRSNKKYVSSF